MTITSDWKLTAGQIFRIGTVRYAEGLWRMRRHGPVIAHCTDSEDFPTTVCEVSRHFVPRTLRTQDISAPSHWCRSVRTVWHQCRTVSRTLLPKCLADTTLRYWYRTVLTSYERPYRRKI